MPLLVAPAALARTTTLTGVVQLQHVDPKTPSGPVRFVLSLRTTSRSYRLRLAGPKSLAPGSYVRVRGTRRGGLFRVRSARRLPVRTRAARRLVAASSLVRPRRRRRRSR